MTTDQDLERHAALVDRLVEAYNEQDDDALLALVHPRFEFTPLLVRAGLVSDAYEGAEGIRRYLRDVRGLIDGVRLEPQRVQPISDTVVAIGAVTGRRGERAISLPTTWVLQFEDRLVRRLVTFTDDVALRTALGAPAGEVASVPADTGFEVEVLAVPQAIPALRAALAGWLGRLRPSGEDLGAILLAVTEAATNAVVHAYVQQPVGILRVAARVIDGELTVEVADEGRGMVPRPDSPGLGMGLPLIGRLARAVTIVSAPDRPAGCALRMAFSLARSRGGGAPREA